jgi:hypothetical protein
VFALEAGLSWCVQLIDFGVSRKILGVGMTEVLSAAARRDLQVHLQLNFHLR